MKKLSVHLVSWNGSKYIPYLFDSLRKQTFHDWELLVIDNNSSDNTLELMQKELLNFPVASRVIVNKENIGFAPGHNQAYRETESKYFLLLNQDMYIEPNCFERMIQFLDSNQDAAAVSPRLMRWDFSQLTNAPVGSEVFTKSLTSQVDALGLKVLRNRRVIEYYTRHNWNEVKSRVGEGAMEVFGVSGAFPMLRRNVVDEICVTPGRFFEESFFSYKEDVDLAFRLASHGAKSFVLLDTVAYHDRTGAGPKETNDWTAFKNKKNHNKLVRYYSYRNHFLMLYRNEYWQNFLLDFPWILWYEVKKFGYFLLFDRRVVKGLGDMWEMRKELKEQRLKIKNFQKVDWRALRKWWS